MTRSHAKGFFLVILAALASANAAWAGTLLLDFDYVNSVVTQSGWRSFAGADQYSSATHPVVTKSFAHDELAGPGNSVNVSLDLNTGNLFFRNYNAVSGSTINNVLRDDTLLNAPGVLSLTLGNLVPGEYRMTTYHHSTYGPQTASSHFDLRLTDALGTNTLFTSVPVSFGTNVTTYTSRTFTLRVLPAMSVTVVFDCPDATSGNHFALNGFELTQVPEPGAATLAGFGAVVLAALVRRRR